MPHCSQIDKSHPVHVRNEGAKKRKKVRPALAAPARIFNFARSVTWKADGAVSQQAPPPPPEPRIIVKDKVAKAAAAKQEVEAKANGKKVANDKAAPNKPACVPRHLATLPQLPARFLVAHKQALRWYLVRSQISFAAHSLKPHLLLTRPVRCRAAKAVDFRLAAANIRAQHGFTQAVTPRAPAPRPAPVQQTIEEYESRAPAAAPSAWGARKGPAADAAPQCAWARAAPAAATPARSAAPLPAWGATAGKAGGSGAVPALPVGAEALVESDGAQIGKAARKNQKRAEKKAAQRAQVRPTRHYYLFDASRLRRWQRSHNCRTLPSGFCTCCHACIQVCTVQTIYLSAVCELAVCSCAVSETERRGIR